MDIKHVLRSLVNAPGFTLVAVLTLALGIGANSAIFSVVYTVLLKPLPFPEPESLVRIWETRPARGWERVGVSPNFWDYREQNKTFEGLAAMARGKDLTLIGEGFPEQVSSAQVTAGFFPLLGIRPVLGRTFLTGQGELSAANRELLLSHEFWRTKFASEQGVVGASITLDGESHTVVGVLPPGRPWLDAAQVFTPRVRDLNADRTGFGVMVIGRLAPGISIETARLDLESIFRRLQTSYPELREEPMGFLIQPASEWVAGAQLRRSLWVLLAAVGFILLIASVNLTHLLLARATARRRETAIRAALGAGRGRLVRQFLAESLVLGLLGAGAGLLLAVGAIQLLKVFDPGDIPRLAEVTIDMPCWLSLWLWGCSPASSRASFRRFRSPMRALLMYFGGVTDILLRVRRNASCGAPS